MRSHILIIVPRGYLCDGETYSILYVLLLSNLIGLYPSFSNIFIIFFSVLISQLIFPPLLFVYFFTVPIASSIAYNVPLHITIWHTSHLTPLVSDIYLQMLLLRLISPLQSLYPLKLYSSSYMASSIHFFHFFHSNSSLLTLSAEKSYIGKTDLFSLTSISFLIGQNSPAAYLFIFSTKYPEPIRELIYPSDISCLYAISTVFLETFISEASALIGLNILPSDITPDWIS